VEKEKTDWGSIWMNGMDVYLGLVDYDLPLGLRGG
jgi:hypothetical protein